MLRGTERTREVVASVRRTCMVDSVPRNYGPNGTILMTLSLQGIYAVMTIEGFIDAEIFQAKEG